MAVPIPMVSDYDSVVPDFDGRPIMTITLPDEMRQNLEARAKSAGFDKVDEYVEEVMTSDQLSIALGDPAIQSRLEISVGEAMDSGPAVPVTAEFWERLNAKVAGRLANGVAD